MKEKMMIMVWGDYLREAINRGMAIIQGNNMVMIILTLSLIVSHTVVILSTFQINVSEDQHTSCSFAGFKASLSLNFFFLTWTFFSELNMTNRNKNLVIYSFVSFRFMH